MLIKSIRNILGINIVSIVSILLTICVLFFPKLAHGEGEVPIIRLQTSASDYRIKAEISIPHPPEAVYRIFTDYESIDEHISLFKVSQIIKRKGNTVHVRQVHVLEILFFKYETESILEVSETPFEGFSFKEIQGDYKIHNGSWTLIPENNGQSTLVKYDTQVIPYSYVPRWMVVYFLKKNVQKSFKELYEWIEASRP